MKCPFILKVLKTNKHKLGIECDHKNKLYTDETIV